MAFLQFASTWLWRGMCCIAERSSGCPSGLASWPHAQWWLWRFDYTSPGMLTPGTLEFLEFAALCLSVVICGDCGYSACNWRVLNRRKMVLWCVCRWGYGPILLLDIIFWLQWRCTISHIFLQVRTQLHLCCCPAALRSWLQAFHVYGEIVFHAPCQITVLMQSINVTSPLLWFCSFGGENYTGWKLMVIIS